MQTQPLWHVIHANLSYHDSDRGAHSHQSLKLKKETIDIEDMEILGTENIFSLVLYATVKLQSLAAGIFNVFSKWT